MLAAALAVATAFVPLNSPTSRIPNHHARQVLAKEVDDPTDEGIVWIDEDESTAKEEEPSVRPKLKSSPWDSLNPKIKARIVQAGQERAIANKKKTESAQTKKRRKLVGLLIVGQDVTHSFLDSPSCN